jgi:3-oxoadipate enol-lactonase
MTTLHFQQNGQGPVVMLSHALGCDLGMWDEVAQRLQPNFTVVRYDQRGHGQSPCPTDAFTVYDMADDAAALIRELGGQPVHFVGLSMGGMVAQALAVRHPELVRSVVIANSASHYDDDARLLWQTRVQTVRSHGMAAIVDGALQRWLTPAFRSDPVQGFERTQVLRRTLVHTSAAFYAASCEAVAGIDFRESNHRITCPALVIGGLLDEATPPVLSDQIAQAIPAANSALLNAAHLSAIEQPDAFTSLVVQFFKTVTH